MRKFSLLLTLIIMFPSSGTTIGLKFSVCGQIGVINNTLLYGLIIGPPAESEYPVEPVGDEINTPSPRKFTTYSFLYIISSSITLIELLLSITISLIALRTLLFSDFA